MKRGIKSCLLLVVGLVVLLVLAVGVMYFLDFCPPAGPWPLPPWCTGNGSLPSLAAVPVVGGSQDEDFDYYQPGEIQQVLDKPLFLISPDFGKPEDMIPADGAGWAGLQVDDWSPRAVQILHSKGLHLIGAGMTIRHLNISSADPKPELAALDLDGNPIPLTKPGMEAYLPGEYFYSIYNPGWQELLLEQGRAMIDFGAEGIVMDEPSTYGSLVFEAGGSFDEYSLAAFRDYLAQKYTPEQLLERFEIQDIQAFDFRQYLLDKGLRDSWNVSRQDPPPITYEFFLFQNQGADAFLRRFVSELRTYAREQYNRDFVFSFNSTPQYDFSRFMPVDYLDYLTGEAFYFGAGHTRAAINGKLLEGTFEGQIILLGEVGLDTGAIPEHTVNLAKYIFADIYSNPNTGLVIPTDNIYTMLEGSYQETFVTYDLQELERYYRFMDQNRHLFGLPEPAEVGLVHSSPSLISYLYPSGESLWGSTDALAAMDVLLSERVPFGMLVSGDGIWSQQRLTLEDLRTCPVVVLPGVELISDEEIEALLAYVRDGGVVIQINGFGTYDLEGKPVRRPQIEDLTSYGIHSLGQGTWHTLELWEELGGFSWNADEERQIQPAEHSPDDPAAVAIREALSFYLEPEIQTDAPYSVAVRRYASGESWVLHLVNYEYDQTADQFTPTGPFQLITRVGGTSISQARLYDFESGQISEIPFEQDGDSVTLEIPSLEVYAVVELLP
jgi:hypothetical protein